LANIFKVTYGSMGIVALLYWQKPKTLWNLPDGNCRFLLDWFGKFGEHVQNLMPNFFLATPAPQIVASFYFLVFVVVNFLAVRDHRKLTASR